MILRINNSSANYDRKSHHISYMLYNNALACSKSEVHLELNYKAGIVIVLFVMCMCALYQLKSFSCNSNGYKCEYGYE